MGLVKINIKTNHSYNFLFVFKMSDEQGFYKFFSYFIDDSSSCTGSIGLIFSVKETKDMLSRNHQVTTDVFTDQKKIEETQFHEQF